MQRQQVRDIIDKYKLLDANGAKKSKSVSQSIIQKREAVNSALMARTVATDDNLSDLLEVLSFKTSIDKVLEQRKDRLGGDDTGYTMERCKNDFAKQISSLFKAAVSLLPDNAPLSVHANLFGQDVEVMLNRHTGAFSVKIGEGNLSFTANLEDSIQNVITYLKSGIVLNRGEVFNAEMIGNLLDIHYSADIMNGLLASDRTSDTRQFAAKIIAAKMADNPADKVMNANINTNFLVMLAKEVLDGKIPDMNLDALQARHEALKVELG